MSSALAAIALSLSNNTQADVFHLKTGGQIAGAIIDRGQFGEYLVKNENGAIVRLSRRQVEKVITQNTVDLQYLERSRSLSNTVEAHQELAIWCKQNRLTNQSQHHLKQILELDPENGEARLSLGYQEHHGRWMTQDEIMTSRGLLKYNDGKYRTPQDIVLRENEKKRKQAEVDWLRDIRIWVAWLNGRRVAEGTKLITDIDDPYAAKALVQLLEKQRNQSIRDLLTETLARLKHPLAVKTLVDLSIYDPDHEVRLRCLDYLLQFHQPLSLKPYVSELKSKDNEIVNRAAEALLKIGDPRAISPLIDALITTHKFKNLDTPPGDINANFSPSGGGGLSMGGQQKIIKRDVKNVTVQQALVELSGGQTYGFDEKLWRMWFVNEQIQNHVDARRD